MSQPNTEPSILSRRQLFASVLAACCVRPDRPVVVHSRISAIDSHGVREYVRSQEFIDAMYKHQNRDLFDRL